MIRPQPSSTLFPYTTLFRSDVLLDQLGLALVDEEGLDRRARTRFVDRLAARADQEQHIDAYRRAADGRDRKSTRLSSSHVEISYAVFCLKKKKKATSTRRYY